MPTGHSQSLIPPSTPQYMLVPLRGAACGQMRGIYNYVAWILGGGGATVQSIAAQLQWAVMSLKISQAAMAILDGMTCLDGCAAARASEPRIRVAYPSRASRAGGRASRRAGGFPGGSGGQSPAVERAEQGGYSAASGNDGCAP